MIGLCDCNSFYASCERLFRPDLYHSPIAVLSNNDGVVVALNREAKDLGFSRGDVYAQVRDSMERKGVSVFSSNYALYQNLSDRVMSTLSSLCPSIEQYSIDEALKASATFRASVKLFPASGKTAPDDMRVELPALWTEPERYMAVAVILYKGIQKLLDLADLVVVEPFFRPQIFDEVEFFHEVSS